MQWCKQKFPALVMLLGGAVVLAAALTFSPNADGWGDDGRWRLPRCSFKTVTGWVFGRPLPCATCGFTHAFACAAHGRFGEAFREQPAGAVAFFAMLAMMAGAAWKLGAGSPPARLRQWQWVALGVAGGVLLLGAWVWKLWEALHAGQ
ncbi:MAG: DUF2752 domain-containing protein [Verrucomicrobia bacterium]|nr:DUF2752 domain-containing protein [Verrucomicrobiota bacterium]